MQSVRYRQSSGLLIADRKEVASGHPQFHSVLDDNGQSERPDLQHIAGAAYTGITNLEVRFRLG